VTSALATSGRERSRRSTSRRAGAAGSRITAGTSTKGGAGTATTPEGPGKLVFPVYEYRHTGGNCTVIGGYVYRGRTRPAERGRYVFGDYCSGLVWSLVATNGKARAVRREPFRIPGLTSFGEDSAGELYAVGADGALFRLS
jgi:hypothetical protein